jgi:hypothetical protein
MSPDIVHRQIELATLFVRRLLGLQPHVRAVIPIPSYQDEYYVQATLQVRLLLQRASRESASATSAPAQRLPDFVARAEQAIEKSGLPGELGSIAAEAVRAILIWPLAEAQPWAASVYQPFESIIPYGWTPR